MKCLPEQANVSKPNILQPLLCAFIDISLLMRKKPDILLGRGVEVRHMAEGRGGKRDILCILLAKILCIMCCVWSLC